ncbi:MAG TPA: hypothetical protein PK640_05910 [Verrucomicrobiota bacterium]|nr:hypothetical protein [Verrucomicrobiota bacterium]
MPSRQGTAFNYDHSTGGVGGGGNDEFFTFGPDNTKSLVNDRDNPHAVKAYVPSAVQPTVSIALLADGKVQVTFEGKLR